MTAKRERRNGGEAYKLGQSGELAPDWVLSDEHFLRQFELGQQNPETPPEPATPPAPLNTPRSGAGGNPRTPAKKAPAKKAPAKRRTQRDRPDPVGQLRTRASTYVPAGDTGGLLLALVLYPVALSILRYGAAGPGMWFRAKFLNQEPSSSAAAKAGAAVGGALAPALAGAELGGIAAGAGNALAQLQPKPTTAARGHTPPTN